MEEDSEESLETVLDFLNSIDNTDLAMSIQNYLRHGVDSFEDR